MTPIFIHVIDAIISKKKADNTHIPQINTPKKFNTLKQEVDVHRY